MDGKIRAVLDAYDERNRQERKEREAVRAAGGDGDDLLDRHLLSLGPEAGQLVNIIARSFTAPNILEIGTSYGYSAIWLGEAARATGGRVTTLELKDFKSAYARGKSEEAGLAGHVDFKVGDAVTLIRQMKRGIDFVLLDLWKDQYVPCLDAFYPKLNSGAIIVADNMLHPGGEAVQRYGRTVRAKPGITSVLLPVGSGLEISRYEED